MKKIRQEALWSKNGQKTDKFKDISTIDAVPGTNWVSKRLEGTTECWFIGFKVNHVVLKQLETKIIKNLVIFDKFRPFLRGFLLLAPLKPGGWNGNLKIIILWSRLVVLEPFTTQYNCQKRIEIVIDVCLPQCTWKSPKFAKAQFCGHLSYKDILYLFWKPPNL